MNEVLVSYDTIGTDAEQFTNSDDTE